MKVSEYFDMDKINKIANIEKLYRTKYYEVEEHKQQLSDKYNAAVKFITDNTNADNKTTSVLNNSIKILNQIGDLKYHYINDSFNQYSVFKINMIQETSSLLEMVAILQKVKDKDISELNNLNITSSISKITNAKALLYDTAKLLKDDEYCNTYGTDDTKVNIRYSSNYYASVTVMSVLSNDISELQIITAFAQKNTAFVINIKDTPDFIDIDNNINSYVDYMFIKYMSEFDSQYRNNFAEVINVLDEMSDYNCQNTNRYTDAFKNADNLFSMASVNQFDKMKIIKGIIDVIYDIFIEMKIPKHYSSDKSKHADNITDRICYMIVEQLDSKNRITVEIFRILFERIKEDCEVYNIDKDNCNKVFDYVVANFKTDISRRIDKNVEKIENNAVLGIRIF